MTPPSSEGRAADPSFILRQWWQSELIENPFAVAAPCCLATTGLDGAPNARFLDLKEVDKRGLVVTGPVTSRKGREIESNPEVALACWWPATGRQVRIQGRAESLPDDEAGRYFEKRSRVARLVSLVSQQGAVLVDLQDLKARIAEAKERHRDQCVPRPEGWGGYLISPRRLELFTFDLGRIHERTLYIRSDAGWQVSDLEP